jgi:hypothetical protein
MGRDGVAVSTEISLQAGRPGVQFPVGTMMGLSSLLHRVQAGSGAHPTSYAMDASYSIN